MPFVKIPSAPLYHINEEPSSKMTQPDTSKLEKVVGWKPNVSFEEGLKRTIMWFSQIQFINRN